MQTKKIKILKKGDLQDGEMKKLTKDGYELLMVRKGDQYHALGAYCTHYGASLEEGSIIEDRIVCPWHHACFSCKTGNLEEPPARDSLPSFPVTIKDEEIFVEVPEKMENFRIPKMVSFDKKKDTRTYIILGAGAAGNAAAQGLRESGFQGRIILISQEERLPYDRPNLSKDYLSGSAKEEWMPLRSREFYKKADVELLLGMKVEKVDIPTKKITFQNDKTLIYDKILLATGSIPNTLKAEGIDLKNIFTLRTFDDADRIISSLQENSKVVIIGSSFIGMETAHSLRERKLEVEVVSLDKIPFERAFGKEIGKFFQDAHEKNGVKFHLNTPVSKFEGNVRVKRVVLANGKTLDTDLVLIGVGVHPATDNIHGLDLAEDGSIPVNKNFRAAENVYAAGDISRFPFWLTGETIRIEHWRTAEQLGRIAARNMAGTETEYRDIPFFWTNQAGIYFRYIGYAAEWDNLVINGTIQSHDFLAFYLKNETILAVAGCGRDKSMTVFHEKMRLKKMPFTDELKNGKFS
jgi:NADPH-dependent 2,4-dienoyl-CoA reductase/sulfur reductase-like enzyme/nitrite reductase/ring-hydroxylating ferredoxin subunit